MRGSSSQARLRLVRFRGDQQSHRDHRRFVEPVAPEKFLSLVLGPIGQERNAKKIFLAGELDRVLEQHRPVTVALELFIYYQVLEQNHETALRRADGEKQIDHADDDAIPPQDEHAPAARLFENQSQTADLLRLIGAKIALLREEFAEHLGQFIQISLGSRLNDDFFAHRLHCLFAEIERACNLRIDDRHPLSDHIDNTPLHPNLTALNSRRAYFSAL
jgi:hypothetical protein